MMKFITTLLLGLSLFSMSDANAQAACNVTASPSMVTLNCGDTLNLDALGLSANPVLATNFDGGAIGAGWSTTAIMLYNNPCGPSYDGTPAAWFGNVPLPRTLTSNGFDLSCGGQVCFDLDLAGDDICGGCSDCEDPDLIDEGVFFQYSINGGATWVDIYYFQTNSANSTPYYSWNNYCFMLPPAAWTTNTMFRWDQPNISSSVNDHWGIDNVSIIPSNCGYWYDWSNVPGSNDPPSQIVTPNTSTTYYVDYTNGTDVCSDSVVVTVTPLIASAIASDTNINCGSCTDLDLLVINDVTNQYSDNFDPDYDPTMWNILIGGNANSDCGSLSGNALHFDGTSGRLATTVPIDASNCSSLTFAMYMGNNGSAAPCGDVGPGESVNLQYSINGGSAWTTMVTLDQALWETNSAWQQFNEIIPAAAQTTSTIFRWIQPSFSPCWGCDNWALDNVNVACQSPNITYSWTPITGLSDPTIPDPTACPVADITYTATVSNSVTGCSATDDIDIFVGVCACMFNSFTYNINQCEAGGTYSISGDFDYFLNPGTGTIVVEATNASGTYTQTITGPFTDFLTTNYLVSGIPSDGSPVTINVYFSDETTCESTLSGNSPILPTATNFTGGATYCAGDAIAPLLVDVTGTGPWTIDYTLDGTAMTVSGAASPIDLAPTTSGDYVITLVTDANCFNAASGTQTIVINDLPTVTDVTGGGVYCEGDPVNDILVDVTGTAPWTLDYTLDATAMTSSNPTSPFNLGNTPGVYAVTGISDANCSNTASGTQTITINALPNVSAGIDFTICEDDPAVLTGSGATSYVWNNGVTNGTSFNPATTATHTVVGTDVNGCVSSDSMILIVEPLPTVSFIADDTDGCSPHTVEFTNTTPGNITTCIWSIEGAEILDGLTANYTFNQPGLYDVTLTATSAAGCTNSETYTDYIYVESDPSANFIPSTSEISVYGSDVTFYNESIGATSYEWYFGDWTGTSFEEEPTVTFPSENPVNYSVTLYALSPLGCIDSMTRAIFYKEDVIFYVPNAFTPNGDEYNQVFQPIFTSGYDAHDFNMLIYNRWGEVIYETNDDTQGWDGTFKGNMVQAGIYTWKIEFKKLYTDERVMVNGHVNLLK
ncbi:MAG: gliding motility-associated C-terminal domain-containing protein [Crocinitomicaceae bacterium]|nr:gliding motility-associated C-terminal domain-containing protein [Crocinitomicaceae bacterium]